MSSYLIREVDASEEEIADLLQTMNAETKGFPRLDEEALEGFWWIASHENKAIGFTGLVPSAQWAGVGYLKRSYVDPVHRGKGLQLKFFKLRERKARRIGWTHLVSDCTCNVHSANNFIRAGYHLYEPNKPWGYPETLYWRKAL